MSQRLAAAIFIVGLLSCVRSAAAQEPDTTRPVQDTTAAKIVADSVRPLEPLADIARGPANGFSDGVWVWDREALNLEAPVTLSDLLERIPGVQIIRSGFYLQPEAASSLGGIGNRVEVWLDGFVLDPLLESSFDLAKLELVSIESVRVERRLGTIRIHIVTLTPKDTRAYSVVEAAASRPNANLFRGIFLVPHLFFGPLGLAIDRIDTNGLLGDEPADQFAGWVKWSYMRKGSGLQLEYRRVNTERDPDVPWPEKHDRSDLIARARARIGSGLVAELFGGRSTQKIESEVPGDTTSTERESTQWGGRAGFESPNFWARGSFRLRDDESLPASQLDGAAGIQFNLGSVTAQVTQSDLRDAGSASEFTVRGEIGTSKIRVFGETTTSDRGVPFLADTLVVDSVPRLTSHKGYRVGAIANLLGITVGAALLRVESDSVTSFGLPFDRTRDLYGGGEATGWELSGRVPLPLIKGLYAQGIINDWRSGNVWLYMPTRSYRTGLELHALPLKSGNLEILGRIEVIHRSTMLVPDLADTAQAAVTTLPPVDYIDAYLQIRIIDVRAFMRYEDLSGQRVADIPTRSLPGPRIIYGVKWQFFN